MAHASSELIINPDGTVYHLGLTPSELPSLIFTVGDPDRVSGVSKYFDRILWKKSRREFTMHCGILGGKEVLVLSTGMGTDNIDIVLNELDALANIDFETRENKTVLTSLTIIRIGTSGAVDRNIPLGSHLFSAGALSFDGLLPFYEHGFEEVLLPHFTVRPFYIPAPADASQLPENTLSGITATLPGFYGPQGRTIRTVSTFKQTMDQLPEWHKDGHHVTNFEMETAGIYALCHLLGHRGYSFSALLANRALGTFHPDPAERVDALIKKVLAWASTLE